MLTSCWLLVSSNSTHPLLSRIIKFTLGHHAGEEKRTGRQSFAYIFIDGEWKIANHYTSFLSGGNVIAPAGSITDVQVEALFSKWNDALATKNASNVAARYSKAGVIMPSGLGMPRTGSEDILQYFVKFLQLEPQMNICSREISKEAGWIMDKGVCEILLNGGRKTVKGNYSFVYTYEDGKWLIRSCVLPKALNPPKPRVTHSKRRIRKDEKRIKSWSYVYRFCHDETFMRASRIDTGENRGVRAMNPNGNWEVHRVRRWDDVAVDNQSLFELWEKSDYAKQLKDDHGIEICKTILVENLCPCCKFGQNDLCADQIMSGAEEGRSGVEKAHKKDFQDLALTCNCDFHRSERAQMDGDASAWTRLRIEDIICQTVCDRKEYPLLKRDAFPGHEQETPAKIPKLHSINCVNGTCKSTDCGTKHRFKNILDCPLWKDTIVDRTDEAECVVGGEREGEEKQEEEEDIVEEEEASGAAQHDYSSALCAWNDAPFQCACWDPDTNIDLVECAEGCGTKIHHLCKNMAEEMMFKQEYPDKEWPPVSPDTNPFERGHVCPNCHDDAREIFPRIDQSEPSTYKVKRWELRKIDRTDKKQRELVAAHMTMGELIKHYLECLAAARAHYVGYKINEWMNDLVLYNTKPTDKRIVIRCDFLANPDLHAKRTACGNVDSHAVVAVFFVWEYTDNGCTNRSHMYIGSSESAGKKNTWEFHIACLKHLIDFYNKRRSERGEGQLLDVVLTTDRCPSQYLCRQNFLQLAMLSSDTNYPIFTHTFAHVSRHKGRWDGDGGVLKGMIEKAVKAGEEGTKPWDFFETSRKWCEFVDRTDVGQDGITSRYINYVVYSEEELQQLNLQHPEHKGHILFADMNNLDDTHPLPDTSELYMVRCFRSDFVPELRVDSLEVTAVKEKLCEIDQLPIEAEDDTAFYERMKNNNPKNPDVDTEARSLFLSVERGEMTFNDLSNSLDSSRNDTDLLIDKILARAGLTKPIETSSAKKNNLKKWAEADPIDRCWILRSKASMVMLHEAMFPQLSKQGRKKKNLGSMKKIFYSCIGHDLGKEPKRARSAEELFMNEYRAELKNDNPSLGLKAINDRLRSQFAELQSDGNDFYWRHAAIRDDERYKKEMKEKDRDVYYLQKFNVPCFCSPCRSGDYGNCGNPFSDHARPMYVKMKRFTRSSNNEDNGCSIPDGDGNDHFENDTE